MATALITDKSIYKVGRISTIDAPSIRINQQIYSVDISDFLPFRVRFENINILPIGLGNTPGIGLQVIGYSNYIL